MTVASQPAPRRIPALIFFMAVTASVTMLSSLFADDLVRVIGDLTYVPLTAAYVAMALLLVVRQRSTKSRNFAVCLFLNSISWFAAEQSWSILDLVYNESPFPSIADLFYMAGYFPMIAAFLILILPYRKSVSNDAKIIGLAVGAALLIPMILLTNIPSYDDLPSLVISFVYPILDAILMWLIVVCIMTFPARSTKFMYYVVVGVAFLIVGDTWFAAEQSSGTYSLGQPAEVFFYWSYVLLAFSAALVCRSPAELHRILRSESGVRHFALKSKHKTVLAAFAAILILAVAISTLNYFKLTRLSTNEETLFFPLLYLGMLAIAVSAVIEAVLYGKRLGLKPNVSGTETDAAAPEDVPLESLERQISRLESGRRKNTIAILGSITVMLAVLSFYIMTNVVEDASHELRSSPGRYVVENLKGDRISTGVAWHIPEGKTLKVVLINSDSVKDDKILAIEDAVLSEQTVTLANSFMNKDPPNLSAVYYKGWKGAFESITQKTKFYPPTKFDVSVSDKSVGDIIIILSTQKDADGTLGFTRTIADDANSEILKSYITIFDVKNLDSSELSAILRHELGHAMGLAHSTDSSDLMYPTFHPNSAFISGCNIDALVSLYDGMNSAEVVCRN